jgi:D-alanyl-D-alanine carboxypeptidase/D-alanyl-D-alanine-endopeptidase (penicillin-binding protein 4)
LLIAQIAALIASPRHPELRRVLTDLPVAGFSGTLAARFRTRGTLHAAGLVRAKTGTLSGVSTLAGVVVDADGRLLAFALMADRAPYFVAAEAALDRTAAVLAGCGCR